MCIEISYVWIWLTQQDGDEPMQTNKQFRLRVRCVTHEKNLRMHVLCTKGEKK
jgi:hypothetical protein